MLIKKKKKKNCELYYLPTIMFENVESRRGYNTRKKNIIIIIIINVRISVHCRTHVYIHV